MKTVPLHRLPRLFSAIALSVAGAFALASPASSATPTPVFDEEVSFSSGELEWGFSENFRCELVGPSGQGRIEVSDGATQIPGTAAAGSACSRDSAGSEAIRFPVIGDYYDPETDSFGIQTEGAVRFSGYPGIPILSPDPTLDFTIRDIYVTAEGDEGSVLADVEGVTPDGEEPLFLDDATLVDLDLSGVSRAERADGIDWSEIPATLTAEGVDVFTASEEGDAFDPLSISANLDPFELEPDPDVDPSKPGRIEVIKNVRAARAVKVAKVFCAAGDSPCGLISPGRTAIKGGGRSASVRVKYPFKIGAGRQASVKLVLGRSGRKMLKATRKAKSKLRLTLTRDGQAVSQIVRVQIRR